MTDDLIEKIERISESVHLVLVKLSTAATMISPSLIASTTSLWAWALIHSTLMAHYGFHSTQIHLSVSLQLYCFNVLQFLQSFAFLHRPFVCSLDHVGPL